VQVDPVAGVCSLPCGSDNEVKSDIADIFKKQYISIQILNADMIDILVDILADFLHYNGQVL